MLIDDLIALEQSLHSYQQQRHNQAYLERIFHDDFKEFTKSGLIITRKEMLAALPIEQNNIEYQSENYTLLMTSPDSAILTYVSKINSDPRPTLRASHWVKHPQQGWQMIFHQGTPSAITSD